MAQRTSEETVQANVAAYNAKDSDAFTESSAPEAKFCKLDQTVLLADREAITTLQKYSEENSPATLRDRAAYLDRDVRR